MTSNFQNNCTFTLMSCVVSLLGLSLLQDHCSVGIAISLAGIAGIARGIWSVAGDLAPLIVAKKITNWMAPTVI